MEKAKSFENQKMQLRLFQDDNNLWRCDEKIGNADVSKPVKHPYILDKKHYLTKLIDVWCTKTSNSTRAEEWISQVRSISFADLKVNLIPTLSTVIS